MGGILSNSLFAKEPTNWLFGFGVGVGLSKIDRKYSDSAKINWASWVIRGQLTNISIKDWSVAYEFLVGYKHFLNDYIGFRYYGNVAIQYRKDNNYFRQDRRKVGIVEYTANADVLVNFYNSKFFTFGILGGFGIGGAYFDSPTLERYETSWGPTPTNPSNFVDRASYANMYKTKRHHLSAILSVGVRANIFQPIRNVNARICNVGRDGRKTCRVPIGYLEHSIEFNTKFSMLTYYATKYGEMIGVANQGQYNLSVSRPGYEVRNPYKFTLRYIFAF